MIAKLRELEKNYGALEFICIGSYGKAFFRITQTGKIIVVAADIIEQGNPNGVARRLKKAFPLNNEEERAGLTNQTRECPYTSL